MGKEKYKNETFYISVEIIVIEKYKNQLKINFYNYRYVIDYD